MASEWCVAQNTPVGSFVGSPCENEATRTIIEIRKNGLRVELPMCGKHAAHYADKAGFEYRFLNESDAQYASRQEAQARDRLGVIAELRRMGATDEQLRKAGLL